VIFYLLSLNDGLE